jgi:hypothetical protein
VFALSLVLCLGAAAAGQTTPPADADDALRAVVADYVGFSYDPD